MTLHGRNGQEVTVNDGISDAKLKRLAKVFEKDQRMIEEIIAQKASGNYVKPEWGGLS